MRYGLVKCLKIILWIVPVLGLVGAVIAMFYLPDTIPIQIGLSGNYSNFGSKYTLFIIPVVSIFLSISRSNPKGKPSNTNPYLILLVELILIGVEIFAITIGLNYLKA